VILASIIADVTAKLNARYTFPGPDGPEIRLTTKIGAQNVAAQDTPPRVVWVPTSDSYTGARLQRTEPRPVKTRNAGLSVHCWAGDLAATAELVNDVVAALHQTAWGNYQIKSGTWVEAALAAKGMAYVIELTIEIPITLIEARETVVTVADVDADIKAGSDPVTFSLTKP